MTFLRYRRHIFIVLFATTFFVPKLIWAQGSSGANEKSESVGYDKVEIIGDDTEQLQSIPGSASMINKEELERFEYDDIHRILSSVAGVYIREEDGYGLRPNIGMRGAASDRSKKITLMEDGVLIAPAPYSAPAAYYFPLMTRMSGVEVFKGPVSIQHGPQTVGGAVNLITSTIPRELRFKFDVAGGMDLYSKVQATAGGSHGQWGWLAETVYLRSDGFKEVDGGGDTGFKKLGTMLKGRWSSQVQSGDYHQWDLKVGYGVEESNETYLGLSDDDFEENPYRRYRATYLDLMKWRHAQIQVSHTFLRGENFELKTTAYLNHFWRSWGKVAEFVERDFKSILAAPDASSENRAYYDVLTGNKNSEDELGELATILYGTNARNFLSTGLQSVGAFYFETGDLKHALKFGFRYHFDGIERDQYAQGMLMKDQVLENDGLGERPYTQNRAQTHAVALYAHEHMTFGDLKVSPGLRFEWIRSQLVDDLKGVTLDPRAYGVLIPGIGVYYGITPQLGVLAGTYRGFSPVTPGSGAETKPETSVNSEVGVRYSGSQANAQVVGFYNLYQNLTTSCGASAGCDIEKSGLQYNAGSVDIYGVEAEVGYRFEITEAITLPLSLTYTFTQTAFNEDLDSADPLIGQANIGDELPYVPEHTGALKLGLEHEKIYFELATRYISPMRDKAGSGLLKVGEYAEALVMVDAAMGWHFTEGATVYVIADNILNEHKIVSRRPYGARPSKPLGVVVGLKWSL